MSSLLIYLALKLHESPSTPLTLTVASPSPGMRIKCSMMPSALHSGHFVPNTNAIAIFLRPPSPLPPPPPLVFQTLDCQHTSQLIAKCFLSSPCPSAAVPCRAFVEQLGKRPRWQSGLAECTLTECLEASTPFKFWISIVQKVVLRLSSSIMA